MKQILVRTLWDCPYNEDFSCQQGFVSECCEKDGVFPSKCRLKDAPQEIVGSLGTDVQQANHEIYADCRCGGINCQVAENAPLDNEEEPETATNSESAPLHGDAFVEFVDE